MLAPEQTADASIDLLIQLSAVNDPRSRKISCLYPLEELLLVGVAAVACGVEDWVTVSQWGNHRLAWLRKYLSFAHGIASHDTFSRVFGLLEAKHFEACFTRMMSHLCGSLDGHFLAIDGKSLRGSRHGDKAMAHLVSVRSTTAGLVLGQVRVAEKTNEIHAIPELIETLELKGATVTMDAMGCQTRILNLLEAKQAQVIVALKDNHITQSQAVEQLFERADKDLSLALAIHTSLDKGHGRVEERSCMVIHDLTCIAEEFKAWPTIKSVVRMSATTHFLYGTKKGQSRQDVRYFIGTETLTAMAFSQHIREHWHIENGLHWVLDVAFREDDCRIRAGDGAQSFAILRRIVLNMLRTDRTNLKGGVKSRRMQMGWDSENLAKLLGLPPYPPH